MMAWLGLKCGGARTVLLPEEHVLDSLDPQHLAARRQPDAVATLAVVMRRLVHRLHACTHQPALRRLVCTGVYRWRPLLSAERSARTRSMDRLRCVWLTSTRWHLPSLVLDSFHSFGIGMRFSFARCEAGSLAGGGAGLPLPFVGSETKPCSASHRGRS